jgi:hypothetical protein
MMTTTYSPVCRELEAATMHFFTFFGWPNNIIIEF